MRGILEKSLVEDNNKDLIRRALLIINDCLNPKMNYCDWVKMPFGQYKGLIVREVIEMNRQYFDWFVYKSGIVPKGLLRKAVDEYVALNGGEKLEDSDYYDLIDDDDPFYDTMRDCLPNT